MSQQADRKEEAQKERERVKASKKHDKRGGYDITHVL